MKLVLYSPVVATPQGFPRLEDGTPYLPGDQVRQALWTAAFVYATHRDKAFRQAVRREVMAEAPQRSLPELMAALETLLFERWPWLRDLSIPDLPLPNVQMRRAWWVRLRDGEVLRDEHLETAKAVLEVDVPLTEEQYRFLDAAGRSFTEALADAEWRLFRQHLPGLEAFYQELKGYVLKRAPLPLRLGYWTEDPYQGRLLVFWRVPEVRQVVRRLYRHDPRPGTVLYAPAEKQTFGWAWLGEVSAL